MNRPPRLTLRPSARTNLSIDKAVFEEFAVEANRRNMTLFAFANQSLSAVARIGQEGGSPEEFYRIWRVLSILRQVDVITLPSGFVEELVGDKYKEDAARTRAKFRELGTSLVGLLKMVARDIEDLGPLAKDLGILVPIKHFRIAKRENGYVEVDVVGAGKAIETTECSAEFLKAVIEGYGYSVSSQELHPGTIRILAALEGATDAPEHHL